VTTKHLKRLICMTALVFVANPFVFAADKNKGSEMTGTVCDQKCVKQDAGKAACDLSCTERSGEAAFVDDQGKAWKVANPTICKGKMGKKAKANVKKMEDPDTLWLNSLSIFG
jgi:hypothetical protein